MERILKFMAAVAGAIAASLLLAVPAQAQTAWWKGETSGADGPTRVEALISIEGERISGRFKFANPRSRDFPNWSATIQNGQITKEEMRFRLLVDLFGSAAPLEFSGYYDGAAGRISGELTTPAGGQRVSLSRLPVPALPSNTPTLNGILRNIESSRANMLAEEFAELFWQYERLIPRYILGNARSGETDSDHELAMRAALREALESNQAPFGNYVNSMCKSLTQRQRALLRDFATARYTRLAELLAARQREVSRAMSTEVSLVSSEVVPLRFTEECGAAATSGAPSQGVQDEVVVGDHLLLSAVLSAMLLDSFILITPERAVGSIDEQTRSGNDSSEPIALSEILFRVRTTPLWTNVVTSFQTLTPSLRELALPDVESALLLQLCDPDRTTKCWLVLTLGFSLMSAERMEIMLNDQIDFVLAHEIGHYSLRHFHPVGNCEVEAPLERDADFFAIALLRPQTGLFAETRTSTVENSIAKYPLVQSGVELFLTQDYPGFREGGCQYPSFAERVAAAKAFEARAFPAR